MASNEMDRYDPLPDLDFLGHGVWQGYVLRVRRQDGFNKAYDNSHVVAFQLRGREALFEKKEDADLTLKELKAASLKMNGGMRAMVQSLVVYELPKGQEYEVGEQGFEATHGINDGKHGSVKERFWPGIKRGREIF
ncbi:MAG: hypothetical protein WC686_04630 [Candidatus Shapirobacteria bacterium]|jgi:hypothetical protein